MWTLVLESSSTPSLRSLNDPATRSIPSSAAIARAHDTACTVKRLCARDHLLARAHHRPRLRQHHQLGASTGRLAHQPVGGLQVAVDVVGGVQLNRCGSHAPLLSRVGRLTSQSTIASDRDRRRVDRAPGRRGGVVPLAVTHRRHAIALALPHRGRFGDARPAALTGLALPPSAMPGRFGSRPLKAWRYVGVFGPELMLCVATVRIGRARQSFWAVWDRRSARLHERTALGRPGSACATDACRCTPATPGSN